VRAIRGAPRRIEGKSVEQERGCCARGAVFLSFFLEKNVWRAEQNFSTKD